MSLTLLIAAVVCMVVVLAWLFSGERNDPMATLESAAERDAREFKAYVTAELHKAQTGAANAEKWAVQLVKAWEKKNKK